MTLSRRTPGGQRNETGQRTGMARALRRGGRALRPLGPGLITAASDADPTTVATLAVVGATTVYALSWLTWLLFPMLAVVLVVATRVGAASGRDLQQCVKDSHGHVPQWALLASVVTVNIVTVAADIRGGAAALGLLAGHDSGWFTVAVAGASLVLLMWGSLAQVQRVLKYVLMCLLAYLAAAVLAHPDWGQVLRGTFTPHVSLGSSYVADALALMGTTLTAYVYIWQTVEVADERPSGRALRYRTAEAVTAMFAAVAIFWFILVATGATLGVRRQVVNTAGEAARALAPIAGPYASDVFAVALLASALVALPVLMETTGHVIAVQLGVQRGLSHGLRQAPAFYAAIAASAVGGVALGIAGISPIRLLFLASVIGGLATPVGLVALMTVSGDRRVMEDRPVHGGLRAAGWAVTGLITAASLIYLVQQAARG